MTGNTNPTQNGPSPGREIVPRALAARRALGHALSAVPTRLALPVLALGLLAGIIIANFSFGEVQAAKPPFNIAVFVSSRTDVCFDPGDVAAIRHLATRERERLNRQGLTGGRQVRVRILDDASDPQKTIANVRAAIADPDTLAMIGITNSNRAKAAFDAAGREISASGIPFISDISVTSIFAGHPNVFTTRASQDDDRLPVLAGFMRQHEFSRPAFVGIKDMLFSTSLGDGLKAVTGGALLADHRLRLKDDKLEAGEVAAMIADLKDKKPDLVFLTIGTNRTAPVLRQLAAQSVTPALFITGRLENIPADALRTYPNDVYQLAWDGLPDVYNDRLRKLISRARPEDWVFEGRRIDAAPGWRKGECKERPADVAADPLAAANMRAIAVGTQFADMVSIVTTAARTAEPGSETAKVRAHVLKELATTYASGRGTFKGSFENWSFQPASRTAVRTPFIITQPRGLNRPRLAPVQFVRLKKENLRRVDTLYLDVSLTRAHRIDDNEKTFFAEFYLSMRDDKGAGIENVEFTNAFLDPRTNDRQLTVRVLHGGGKSDAYPDNMKVYKVAGKFLFEPQLSAYPFDSQRFSIDIQPKRGDAPFIIQPPPAQLRDKSVSTDGWDSRDQYVGYDEDFVSVIDAQTHEPSIVPFYKASFVWLMKRQTTDYFLRVVVPLSFILIVAYLSIFIPQGHFEAIITLQVTALLSAVALYLSLPKLDADTATLSDRIFVFFYMVVSVMIGISVLRVNRLMAHRPMVKRILGSVHIILVPLLIALMAAYVYQASQDG